ncbi:hypothetical protein [Streptomyces sp. cmx-4-9]|uniref:DUF6197 family protein n=1 Tax=Streptomyces sp. cmx-4-9 TaxID=2790941 RepID=UPI00398015E8
MQTLTSAAVEAAAALTLEERLALTGLAMDSRLDEAGLAFDIDTAHVDLPEILTAPMPTATRQPVAVDEVLQEAGRLIAAHGWIRGYVGSAATGYCAIGAIRAAAGGDGRLEDAAEAVLLARIRAEQPDVLSIGAWNDSQSGPAPVIRMLG